MFKSRAAWMRTLSVGFRSNRLDNDAREFLSSHIKHSPDAVFPRLRCLVINLWSSPRNDHVIRFVLFVLKTQPIPVTSLQFTVLYWTGTLPIFDVVNDFFCACPRMTSFEMDCTFEMEESFRKHWHEDHKMIFKKLATFTHLRRITISPHLLIPDVLACIQSLPSLETVCISTPPSLVRNYFKPAEVLDGSAARSLGI